MKLKYRPEIDGLRAIAVISIIFYHARLVLFGKNYFSGGFLGIDIFFVISGYLITYLILIDLLFKNNFSFKIFYEKRIRRIFPLLFIVIIISFIFGFFLLIPSDFLYLSKSSLYSVFFLSNFYFKIKYYFFFKSLLIPLLHTWSLSVEIQFYLIISFIIFLLNKYLKKNIILIFTLMIILSLVISTIYSQKNTIGSYYFIQYRIWEFLSGSILAILELRNKKRIIFETKIVNEIILLIGILLIIFSVYFFNDKTIHPSYLTIFPILGTCIVIWFSKEDFLVTKVLSIKPIVSIGLISYSLFLWHYPIFAFYRYTYASGDKLSKLIFFSALIVISIISFFLIERPFRNREKISFNLLNKILLTLFLLIIASCLTVILNNGFSERYKVGKINLDMNHYVVELSEFRKDKVNSSFLSDDKKILVLGDSHGQDTFDALISNQILQNKYEIVFDKVNDLKSILDPKSNFNKNTSFKNNLNQSDIVILSYLWSKNLSNENYNLLENFSTKLKNNNKKLILVSSPEFEIKGRFTLLDLFILSNKKLPNVFEEMELKREYYNSYINNKKLINTNLKLSELSIINNFVFFDLSKLICNNIMKTCLYLTDDGQKIMFDDDHFTLSGSKFLGKKMQSLFLFDK